MQLIYFLTNYLPFFDLHHTYVQPTFLPIKNSKNIHAVDLKLYSYTFLLTNYNTPTHYVFEYLGQFNFGVPKKKKKKIIGLS